MSRKPTACLAHDAGGVDDMIWIEGGEFTMGSAAFYPEEAPVVHAKVEGFWIDRTLVTNRQFEAFVAATGHVTVAETAPDPKDYPGMLPGMDRAGSLVFHKSETPIGTEDPMRWWAFEFGADWQHPQGLDSTLDGLEHHPVVHVAWADAMAYAKWAGKDLPTEAEWEFAARGGLEGKNYAWGDELTPGGQIMANYWQGTFPFHNSLDDGWERTSPVGAFPPNGYGLSDMIGNTWEWTKDWWQENRKKAAGCCISRNPRGGTLRESMDHAQPQIRIGRKVLKGGSHLCAANYCRRYRPAARHAEQIDTSTSHIGFRCVRRPRKKN